jgi:hypothetical protein
MWLWETEKIFGSQEEEAHQLAFCKARGITDLFVQIPYEAEKGEAGRLEE